MLDRLLDLYRPPAILHLAAERHEDRSLSGPEAFVRTNIGGTFRLPTGAYLAKCTPEERRRFRFLHESVLPLMMTSAVAGKPLPVCGNDREVRYWLYVGDHCSALRVVLERGEIGETYNTGGRNEQANLDTVELLCSLLDELLPNSPHVPRRNLITFVTDRPGHDRRYAINADKIEQKLGWRPSETFASGLRRTVLWYLAQQDWVAQVTSGAYRQWIDQNYAHRGGSAR